MKATSLLIPAIFAGIIIAALIAAVNIPYIKTGQIEKDIEVRSEIHIMGNALDAAKLYMETSLAYSTYQACYDNLQKGGWKEIPQTRKYQGYAVWESSEQHPTILEFKEGFEDAIKENLGLYKGTQAYTFLSDYHVNLPSYTTINAEVDENTGKLSVTATADSNLNIEKTQESGEHIRLEKYGFLWEEYNIDCYGIYAKGMEVYQTESYIIKTFIESISADPKNKQTEMSSFASNIKKQLLPTWTNEPQVTWKEDDYLITAQVLSETALTEYEVQQNMEIYNVNVKVKFEIQKETGNEFPVYDGSTVAFRPMKLTFILSMEEKWPQVPTKGFALMRTAKSSANSLGEYGYQATQDDCDSENFIYYTVRRDEKGDWDDYEECPEEDPCCQEVAKTLRDMGIPVMDETVTQPGISLAKEKKYPACTEPDVPPKGTEDLQRIVLYYAEQNQLPVTTVMSIVQKESTWDSSKTSPMGAEGLFQLTEENAEWLGWEASEGMLTDPAISAKYGTKYYKYILVNVSPDKKLALAAYNAGHNRIKNRLTLSYFCQKTPIFDCVKKYLTRETLDFVGVITTKCEPRFTQYLAQLPSAIGNA